MDAKDIHQAGTASAGLGRTGSGALAAARLRRRLYPFLFRMGPVALMLSCLALVGLLALGYLSQVSAATAANQRLAALQAEQAQLLRQDQLIHQRLGVAQSPAYIDRHARDLGLVPAPAGSVVVIPLPEPGASSDQSSAGGQP